MRDLNQALFDCSSRASPTLTEPLSSLLEMSRLRRRTYQGASRHVANIFRRETLELGLTVKISSLLVWQRKCGQRWSTVRNTKGSFIWCLIHLQTLKINFWCLQTRGIFYLILKNLFTYLAAVGLRCGVQYLWLQRAHGLSSCGLKAR